NVDRVFVVTSPNGDFNPRRVERYLAAVWDGGAEPILVLNKVDLSADSQPFVDALEAIAPGVPIVRASALTGDGVPALAAWLQPGVTGAVVGMSGVGKSTLLNALLGAARQETSAVREDNDRGRHTTTRRELLALPGGGLVIDTPGMRILGLWQAEEGLGTAFA